MNNRQIFRLLFGSLLIILAACGAAGNEPADVPTPENTVEIQEESQPSLLTEGEQNTAVNSSTLEDTVVEEVVTETETAVVEPTVEIAASDGIEFDANGIQVGFTANGYPYRGNPDASIVIEEFSDYQ